MLKAEFDGPLDAAAAAAKRWLKSLDQRPVGAEVDGLAMLEAFDEPLAFKGEPAELVVALLAERAGPGLMATGSGRFHAWVVGGALPAAIAADWLVSSWDQNAAMSGNAPAVCAIEQVTARWILQLLDLPATCSVGFVTGGQMANTVCLAAARDHVLNAHGWDVEVDGLVGAPPVTIVVGEERHSTIDRGLRLLGLGSRAIRSVEVDEVGRMLPGALEAVLSNVSGPTIVSAQAGNVNGGTVDPFGHIRDVVDRRRTDDIWLHVDGAFGLWARAEPSRRYLLDDVERADSWATDAHKWLNTPYDCGMAICARPEAHRRAMGIRTAYLPAGEEEELRNPVDFNPEFYATGPRRPGVGGPSPARRRRARAGGGPLLPDGGEICEHARRRERSRGDAPGAEPGRRSLQERRWRGR